MSFVNPYRFASAGGGPSASMANPNYYRTAILIDATGQSNGTGYATDESRNAWALTFNGSAAISSGQFEFNGTTDYISVPHSILWTPGSKFSMCVQGLQLDKANATSQCIVNQDRPSTGERGWAIRESGGNFVFDYSTDGLTQNSITIGAASAGPVYDIVVSWNGTTISTLLNGVQGGSAAFAGQFFDTTRGLRFGSRPNSGSGTEFYLDGRFTSFFYTRGEVLTNTTDTYSMPSLPLAMNNPALTDSNWGSVLCVIGYDSALGIVRDLGPYDFQVATNAGISGSTGTTLGDGTPSISFDGSTGYCRIFDDPILEFGSGDLTVETFANFDTIATQMWLIGKYLASGNNRAFGWGFHGESSPKILQGAFSTGASNTLINSASYTPTTGSFAHLAMCRSGSNVRHFVAGTQSGSTGTYSSSIKDNSETLKFGTLDASGLFYDGFMAHIRVTKAARYTGNFTAPTGALPLG